MIMCQRSDYVSKRQARLVSNVNRTLTQPARAARNTTLFPSKLLTINRESLRIEAYHIIQHNFCAPPNVRPRRRLVRVLLLPRSTRLLSALASDPTATELMTVVLARSPLQPLHMATNRATARRRSARAAFEDDDAPAVKRAKTETNGTAKKTNGATRKIAKTGESGATVELPSRVVGGSKTRAGRVLEAQLKEQID